MMLGLAPAVLSGALAMSVLAAFAAPAPESRQAAVRNRTVREGSMMFSRV